MFNSNVMDAFLSTNSQTFRKINSIREKLLERYYEADTAINAVLLASLCGYPCLLFGPPGVAKSKLIRDFCTLTGVNMTANGDTEQHPEDREYFEYLLTKFTEPTELFGAFRLDVDESGLQHLNRVETGMLHNCRIAFLDEVFNGSSAILNSLLALLNERVFHDRGEVKPSKLEILFGATNYPPQGEGLDAIFDRFVIRGHMTNAARNPDALKDYLQAATGAQSDIPKDHCFPGLLDDIVSVTKAYTAREAVGDSDEGFFDWSSEGAAEFFENLTFVSQIAESKGLGSFSNRRVYQLSRALCMQRLLRASREESVDDWTLTFEDYEILWTHFLDVHEPLDSDNLEAMHSLRKMPLAAGADA